MVESSTNFQKSKTEIIFPEKKELLRLYKKEEDSLLVSKQFGPFLPSEPEEWAKQMHSVHETVQFRTIYEQKSIHNVSALLMFLIIKKHALGDGNKRSSILCMLGFYFLNGYEQIDIDPDALYTKVKEIAALDSQSIDDEREIQDLASWLEENISK